MGVLTYQPESSWSMKHSELSLDEIAAECQKIFESNDSNSLDEIFQMGGSSGGARPKVFYKYNQDENRWIMSPAYDLTFSNSIGGEHATTVDGKGKNPGMKELLAVAKNIKLDLNKARSIAEEIHVIVSENIEFVV